jgi:endonuclease/exonuclease/phosphatase family metal-dependent hydrolase
MRVLTWNIWGIPTEGHRSRHAALVRALVAVDPDVAFLQEVWTHNALGRLESLEDYHCLRHLTALRRTPRGGLVTLVRRSLVNGSPKLAFHPYGRPLTPRPWSLSGVINYIGEVVGNKGIGHVELELAGHRCHLLNTHLVCPDTEVDSSQLDDVDNERLIRQAAQIGELIGTLQPPAILMGGDFNVPTGTDGYRELLRLLNASSNGRPVEDLSVGLGPVDLPQYDAPIDFVFGNLLKTVAERRYIDPGASVPGRMSDHPGVLVVGSLPAR